MASQQLRRARDLVVPPGVCSSVASSLCVLLCAPHILDLKRGLLVRLLGSTVARMSDREFSISYLSLQKGRISYNRLHVHVVRPRCSPNVVILCVHAGTPTLQQLSKALKSLENWFVFGVKLAVPHSQLTKIKKSHHEGEIELCKIDMFQYWLDNKLVPTWNEVIRALEETDKVTLASQIKHDYLLSPASEEEGMQNACTGKNKFSDIMAKVQ